MSEGSQIEGTNFPSKWEEPFDLRLWVIGLDADDTGGRTLVAQVPGDPHERSAGTGARHEAVKPPLGLRPDLSAGAIVVGEHVALVAVLIEVEKRVGVLGGLLGLPDVGVLIGAGRQYQLRTPRLHDLASLDGLGLRHVDPGAIALERGDHPQAIPVLPDEASMMMVALEDAGPLGILDDVFDDPVLSEPDGSRLPSS
jgi:hypothetical protein